MDDIFQGVWSQVEVKVLETGNIKDLGGHQIRR